MQNMHISAIHSYLTQFDLTEKEIKVFLALMKKPLATANELASISTIKRPTVYHSLLKLQDKGLISESGDSTKKYSAVDPQRFKDLIEEKRHAIKKLEENLPDFVRALTSQKTVQIEDFSVKRYTGKNGIRSLFDEAFRCKSKKWDIIAPYNNYLRDIDEEFGEYYLVARKNFRVKSRTLWEKGTSNRKLVGDEKVMRNPRFMPKTMTNKFNSLMILYDNSAAFVSYDKEGGGVIITSKDVFKILSAMFETVWEISEKYE